MNWKLAVAALVAAGVATPAGDPAGFRLWKSTELKMLSKGLRPKMNERKLSSERYTGSFGNLAFSVSHREAPGEAEVHQTQTDIFVVQTGEATLTYGGTLVDAKSTGPNELRGPSISGGMETKLVPGDIVTIPAKMPHQLRVDAGKEFTYFVAKSTQ